MKRGLLIVGVLMIAAAGIWKFGFSQPFENRYADGWTWEINTLGQTGYPDEKTGEYPAGTTLKDDPINVTVRDVRASAADQPAGQLLINDHYVTYDTTTNEVTWEYTASATVDAATGRHVDGEAQGDYYFLPRHVDKNTAYTISNSSYHSLPMTFQKEEVIAGVNTYLFAYYGDVDNTDANAEFVTLKPDEKVICFDFSLEYWVEPTTGEIVKYREWCEGDWVVSKSGEKLSTISRWGGETSADDIIRQVTSAQNKLSTYLWATLYGPLAVAIIGLVLIGISMFGIKS